MHFVAEEVRRRGVPVRHLHSWDDYDRFRKVPHGVDPAWSEHVGRPLSAVPDPLGRVPLLGRALQGAAARGAGRAGLRDGGDLADRDVHLRRLPGADPDRGPAAERDRRGARPLPHQGADPRRRRRRRRRTPTAADGRARPGASRSSPTAAAAGATHHRDGVRRRLDRRSSYRCAGVRLSRASPTLATQDEGKLVWKVDWPMRWAFERVDFEPAGCRPLQPRLVVHGRPRAGRDRSGTGRGRRGSATPSSASPGWPRCRPPAAGCRPVGGAARCWRRRSCGGSTCAASPARPSPSTSARRWCGCTTSGTPSAARPPTRPSATRRCWPSSGPRRPRPRAGCRRREVVVPFRTLHAAADITTGDRGQISRVVGDLGFAHSSVDQLEPRLRRAVTWTSEFVAGGGPHGRRATPRTRAARRARRAGGGVAAAARRRPARRTATSRR